MKGIFGGIEINSDKLGKTVIERNKRLLNIMTHIADLNLGSFENKDIDIFGDAYEFMMGQYASNAGKSGGEYFTPQEVSKLLTKLAIGNKTEIKNVYDPACGSGSLLLQVEKILGHENIKDGFYGQESNITTYNLCRMNMFLHNVNFDKFHIKHGDTLIDPQHPLELKFELVVSNPPYSTGWEGKNNPILINDLRFSSPGVLAPKSDADYAFILDALYHLDVNGAAAIVCFPGIFYRRSSRAELKIRKWLVEKNYVAGLIALAPKLFYGTPICTVVMVLSKSKINSKIMMIDASNLFEKGTNQNKLSEDNINQIVDTFIYQKEIEHFSKNVDLKEIEANDFDLSISKYVEPKIIEEVIDIKALNKEIEETTQRIDWLRKEVDLIVKELEEYEYYRNKLLDNQLYPKEKLSNIVQLNKFKQIGASELKSFVYLNGDVTLLPSSRNYDWKAKKEDVKKFICNGKVIALGRARHPNIKYCDGFFVSSNNHLISLENENKVLMRYLYHFIDSKKYSFYVETSTYPKFDSNIFKNTFIPIPSIQEQQKIVDILDKFSNIVKCFKNGIPREIELTRKQYLYWRNKLLNFKEK